MFTFKSITFKVFKAIKTVFIGQNFMLIKFQSVIILLLTNFVEDVNLILIEIMELFY